MDKYVIIDENNGMMLAAISVKRIHGCMCEEKQWTRNIPEALHFEVAEEAEAVITFISDVMDWELALRLHVELLRI